MRKLGIARRASTAAAATGSRSKTAAKARQSPRLQRDSHRRACRPSRRCQRRHAAVGDAARHDQVEMVEVGGDVEREAVARDPARDAHADGARSSRRRPTRRSGPGRGRRDAERRGGRGSAPLRDRGRSDARRSGRAEIEDRIADELAGAVVGDVAAAAGLEHRRRPRRRSVSGVASDVRAAVAVLTPSVMTGDARAAAACRESRRPCAPRPAAAAARAPSA